MVVGAVVELTFPVIPDDVTALVVVVEVETVDVLTIVVVVVVVVDVFVTIEKFAVKPIAQVDKSWLQLFVVHIQITCS